VNEHRSDGKLTVVRPSDESRVGPAAIRRRSTDRAPARPAGEARNQPFEGSCSRSYRRGRSRTNGVVVVDARSNRETGAACRSETQRGATLEARVIARPMEGALDHQYLRRSSRIDAGGWSWPRARRHLLGPPGRGVTAERGDGSVRGSQLGRRRGKKTPASQSRNRLHPKCVGRRETRHASGGLFARRDTARSPNETWVPVVEVSLAEAGRTHLWSMTCAFVVKRGRKPGGNGVRGST
jgi:hypothetical protein